MSGDTDADREETYLREQEWDDLKATILGRIEKIRNTCMALEEAITDSTARHDLSIILMSADVTQNEIQKLAFTKIAGGQGRPIKIARTLRARVSDLHGYAGYIPEYLEGITDEQKRDLKHIELDAHEIILPAIDQLLHPLKWVRAEADDPGPISSKNGSVLVVDNNSGILNIYKNFLEENGHRPTPARDGHEALQILQDVDPCPFEVILLDLHMTGISGFDVLKALKSRRATRRIPVLMTKAKSQDNDEYTRQALELGAVDVVPKLVDQFFVSRFRNCLVQYRLDQEYRNLLGQVLPPRVVEQYLKNGQRGVSKKIPYAAVLFVDLCGFTSYSANKEASVVVDQLERVFNDWDRIAEIHGVQKIKTIGDGFMAVAEIPDGQDPDDPIVRGDLVHKCVECGLEMLRRLKLERKIYPAGWDLRVGVNGGGPVVAGLLGQHRFLYDLWGAAVNKASRMESHGKKGRVNLSQDAYELVKDRYEDGCWDDLDPEPIELKGLEAEGKARIFGLRPEKADQKGVAGGSRRLGDADAQGRSVS